MLKILRNFISNLVISHFNALFQQLDPVEDLDTTKRHRPKNNAAKHLDPHLFTPALLIVTSFVYGTFGLDYESTGSYLDLSTVSTSSHIFTHQIVLPALWTVCDMLASFNALSSVATFLIYSFKTLDNQKYKMHWNGVNFVTNSQILNRKISNQIIGFHRDTKWTLMTLIGAMHFAVIAFMFVNVWINQAFVISLFSLLYWSILLPGFVFYLIFALIGFAIYIIVSSRYITIRQRYVIRKLAGINRKLAKSQNVSNSERRKRCGFYYGKYFTQNQDFLHICSDIELYAQFWSSYLSVVIPNFIFTLSYLIYILIRLKPVALVVTTDCFVIMVLLVFLYLLIRQCATVVQCGERFQSQNREFMLVAQKMAPLSIGKLLKMELLQDNRLLGRYAFTVLSNHRITSETFHMLVTYISIFLMLIIKKPNIVY